MSAYFRILDKHSTSGIALRVSADVQLYNYIYRIVGDKLASNGIPVAIEADGWGEIACVGEVFETEDFVVIVEDDDDL